jgi:hypothetical protein
MLQLWRVCLAVAVVGLAYFFIADALVMHPKYPTELTGGEILREAWGDAWRETWSFLADAADELGDMMQMQPHAETWIAVGTAVALVAPLALRNRPSRRAHVMLLVVCGIVLFVFAVVTTGFLRFQERHAPGPAYWVWAGSIALLCASPWLRRRDQFELLALWERRPNPPREDLPPLKHMPAAFAVLVEQTRAVRVSLEVLTGLDHDARQLLWEWCAHVDKCGPQETALLAELGLGSAPVRELTEGLGPTGPSALFGIDAALARFERQLLDYRSYGFR